MNIANGFRHKGGLFAMNQTLLDGISVLTELNTKAALTKVIQGYSEGAVYQKLMTALEKEDLLETLLDIITEETRKQRRDESKISLLRACVNNVLVGVPIELDPCELIARSEAETKALHHALNEGQWQHPLNFSSEVHLYPISATITLGQVMANTRTLASTVSNLTGCMDWSLHENGADSGKPLSPTKIVRKKEWGLIQKRSPRADQLTGMKITMSYPFNLSTNRILPDDPDAASVALNECAQMLDTSLYVMARQALAFIVEELLIKGAEDRSPRVLEAINAVPLKKMVPRLLLCDNSEGVGPLLAQLEKTNAIFNVPIRNTTPDTQESEAIHTEATPSTKVA